jgi:hypothetical protein
MANEFMEGIDVSSNQGQVAWDSDSTHRLKYLIKKYFDRLFIKGINNTYSP